MRGRWRVAVNILAMMVLLMAASLARAQEAPAGLPANPHDQLRNILQRPLYQRWRLRQEREQIEESGIITALREKIQGLGDWLGELLHRLFFRKKKAPGGSGKPWLTGGLYQLIYAVAWVAVGVFLLALGILIWRLVRGRNREADSASVLSREQVASALSQGNALALRGDQWLDEAGRLASEKDFRAMYRALYLALLAGLHAKGKIVFDRHCTNWTYVTRYRGDAAERDVFSSLTDLFDSVWYGLKASGGEDLEVLRKQVQGLTATAPGQGEMRAQ